jgi:hypothetical protein
MAELKTKKTELSVARFIGSIADTEQQKDARVIIDMMHEVTKSPPKMWWPAIIGFGDRHLVYDSGRELDWFVMGFSPRKNALSLYLSFDINDCPLLEKLWKYKTGKGCLYIKKLSDVDKNILKEIIKFTQSANFSTPQ